MAGVSVMCRPQEVTPTASRHSTRGCEAQHGNLVKAVFKKDAEVPYRYSEDSTDIVDQAMVDVGGDAPDENLDRRRNRRSPAHH